MHPRSAPQISVGRHGEDGIRDLFSGMSNTAVGMELTFKSKGRAVEFACRIVGLADEGTQMHWQPPRSSLILSTAKVDHEHQLIKPQTSIYALYRQPGDLPLPVEGGSQQCKKKIDSTRQSLNASFQTSVW